MQSFRLTATTFTSKNLLNASLGSLDSLARAHHHNLIAEADIQPSLASPEP
jgi:hypothetical protein